MKVTCRICGIQQGEFFTLDSMVPINGQKDHKLLDIFNKSFQLNAYLQDALPQVICLACFEKLKQLFEFQLQAKKSDAVFRETLGGTPTQEEKFLFVSCFVPNLNESKLDKDIKTEIADLTTVEELEDVKENYDEVEDIQNNEDEEEIEDTDILFELYNKNDSCMEKYFKYTQSESEDISEDGENEIEKPIKENITSPLSSKSSEKADEYLKPILPCIEISRIELPITQKKTIMIEPLVEIRKWQCSDCGRKYLTEETLEQHRKLHNQSENCECEICGINLKNLFDYGEHVKSHVTERKFSCELCDKTFSTRHNLKAHIKIHSNLRPFKCEICGKAFQQKSILKTHMTLHTGKPFQCSLCHRRFSRTAHLNIHMRQHNNIRPYQCSQCSSSYMQKSHLDRHISSTHLGVRFQCTSCEKMYTKKPTLKAHMREAHCTTSSIYSCDICDLDFTKQTGLYYHLKSKHPDYRREKLKY